MATNNHSPNSERMQALRQAAEHWKRQLVDVSGRNRLLNYRHLKVGTLDLTPDQNPEVDPQTLNALLAGRAVHTTKLFPGQLFTAGEAQNVRKRLTAIHRQARENLEEKGLDTLFMAIGTANWSVDSGPNPMAPIILVPISITPDGAGRWDFSIEQSGEPHLNPVLVHVLKTQHGVDLTEDEELELPSSFAEIQGLLNEFMVQWSNVRGLKVQPWVVISNFRYTNMPMVADLENNLAAFADNDFVAAIAGVKEAREALAAKISDPPANKPDIDPPHSEFLILDADASQHRAINRILGGESIVVWGPPGTGKSQTIANLIASLSATGKRVLFVAEKRAAIEVVVRRLAELGLSNLVMDAHGGIQSKREFAQNMADSIRNISATPLPDNSSLHHKLQDTREELVTHMQAMHTVRSPWGISLFELQERLIGIADPARTSPPMNAAQARKLTSENIQELKECTQHWVDLEGPYLSGRYSEWARSTVSTAEDAREAYGLVRTLANERLPEAERLMQSIERAGMSAPDGAADWLDALEWFDAVNTFQQQFGLKIYRLNLASLCKDLAPASGWSALFAGIFSSSYRDAKKQVHAALLPLHDNLSDRTLLNIAKQACDDLTKWNALGMNSGIPNAPDNLQDALSAVTLLVSALEKAEMFFPSKDLLVIPISELKETFGRLASQQTIAANLPRIRELERQLETAGFERVIPLIACEIPVEYNADAIEHSWLSTMWDEVSFDDMHVAGFNVAVHDRHQREFVQLDKQHLATTPDRIKRHIAENATHAMNLYPNETALVRREAAKKTRHIPVRRLFREAPHVLTSIRPCWAMSPLLVAELVPAEAELFDVVIFDEASQVPPAEAIGSLARAHQAVIAGDDRQLPPTPFFSSHGIDDEEEEEDDSGLALTGDIESILDIAKAGPLREEMLQWHYRSKDGRLIAFSNSNLYGEALTAFPDTAVMAPLSHQLVPFRPVVQRSTVSHPDEVATVVELIIEHAREHPNESLGVIAFGIRHANNIEEVLRLRLRELADHTLDNFFTEVANERFFVKNIETVQGDERDVIILSVGYHKNSNGTLPYRFGPLNQEGGERRLNVAITRARLRVHVVSSFSQFDMEPGRSKARGVELLRQYLEFASSGGTELGATASDVSLNAFELDVMHRLQERGVSVTPQYGVAGYRIDFACAHPDQPGRMVLAIEADGASYHSGQTARERDRLRQTALEERGWSFHRIWSTNWFRNRDEELDRAVEAWKEAVRKADREESDESDGATRENHSAPAFFPPPTPPSPTRGPRPSIRRGLSIDQYSRRDLLVLAQWILSDTLLRTDEELMAEMRSELGFQRRGSRIDSALGAVVQTIRNSTRS